MLDFDHVTRCLWIWTASRKYDVSSYRLPWLLAAHIMGPKRDIFTKNIECTMIQMVRQHPLLWDTTIAEYRRTDLKRMHWDQIAQALGSNFTGDMVHKRFQNMESTFRANKRKIRESKARCSGKGTDEIYKPKWEYYDMFCFLKKTCAQTNSIDNLSSQSHISLSSQETVNCSPVSHLYSDVQNSSRITNIYYDKNTQQYVLDSLDLCESNSTTNSNNDRTSPSICSESYISSEPTLDPVSLATTSTSINQCQSSRSDMSALSSRIVTSPLRPISTSLNKKQDTEEKSLYVKRGSSKKSKIIEDAMNAIKNMAEENVPPPKMDEFDMLGSYIASKLRSMIPKDRQYYEREILKVLSQPTL